jgi:hypothetical protein
MTADANITLGLTKIGLILTVGNNDHGHGDSWVILRKAQVKNAIFFIFY